MSPTRVSPLRAKSAAIQKVMKSPEAYNMPREIPAMKVMPKSRAKSAVNLGSGILSDRTRKSSVRPGSTQNM